MVLSTGPGHQDRLWGLATRQRCTPVIYVADEALAARAEDAYETLVHEAAHHLARARGHRGHGAGFEAAAREVGLLASGNRTSLPAATRATRWAALADLRRTLAPEKGTHMPQYVYAHRAADGRLVETRGTGYTREATAAGYKNVRPLGPRSAAPRKAVKPRRMGTAELLARADAEIAARRRSLDRRRQRAAGDRAEVAQRPAPAATYTERLLAEALR
jgi:hypothetical protein